MECMDDVVSIIPLFRDGDSTECDDSMISSLGIIRGLLIPVGNALERNIREEEVIADGVVGCMIVLGCDTGGLEESLVTPLSL